MDELMKPVSTSYNTKKEVLIEISKLETTPRLVTKPFISTTASTPDEALEVLKNQPDYDSLTSTLEFLNHKTADFNIHAPGSVSSQLVKALVSETVPNYWTVLAQSEISKQKASKRNGNPTSTTRNLLSCLKSVLGLNAIILSLKQHIQASKESNKQAGARGIAQILAILLQVLEALLKEDDALQIVWKYTWNTSEPLPTRKALLNEFLGLIGGKILGVAAEAEDVLNEINKESKRSHWVVNGSLYAAWIAGQIFNWAKVLSVSQEDGLKACSEVLSKSFRLGHTDSIIKKLLNTMLLQNSSYQAQLLGLLGYLPGFEQKNFQYSVLKILSQDHFSAEITTEADSDWWKSDKEVVAAATRLINIILANEETRKAHLIAWLTGSSGAGVGDGIAIRRAALAALAENKSDIETVLEKSIEQFGDQLYIKHVPSMQQEVHAQILLLSAGYLHREGPQQLSMIIRSGSHLNVVSNRLGASSLRARFLGMVIAEALSGLVDKGDKRMDFKMDEMNTPEAQWYKGLVDVSDTIGTLGPLKAKAIVELPKNSASKPTKPTPKPKSKIQNPSGLSKILAIEEIFDDDDEESSDEDGLQSYAKPDSDAEDSDEDATLVTRNKPTAPVYIRDLIVYLRDSENYDKQKLSLTTTASLIRRKANFGTEVTDHAEELASLLVGIQDKYEIENFEELRVEGMISLIIALPLKMGQWFSKTFFDGDYSLSQRASILTTLGLGAREIAGFGSESNPLPADQPTFPSKSLPETMHKRFTPLPSSALKAINNLSTQLQNTYISPLAASAADEQTGPAVLKLKSFTSRIKSAPRPRTKAIPNHTAQIISTGIFFPLVGRFHTYLNALGSRSSQNIVFQPHLLTHFLKTLSVLLHAAGPSTLSLAQMTSEYWELLLGLRTKTIGDIAVLEGVLFGFLTILEVNEEKRGMVEEHSSKLLETQDWVESVFGRFSGNEEEERMRMLAAGVLVRIREVVEKYQALLMGDLARYE